MALKANQVAATGSAAKLFEGLQGTVTVVGSAAFYLGGANVTSSNGIPCPANQAIPVQVNGEAVYVVAATTANVGYIAGGQ